MPQYCPKPVAQVCVLYLRAVPHLLFCCNLHFGRGRTLALCTAAALGRVLSVRSRSGPGGKEWEASKRPERPGRPPQPVWQRTMVGWAARAAASQHLPRTCVLARGRERTTPQLLCPLAAVCCPASDWRVKWGEAGHRNPAPDLALRFHPSVRRGSTPHL